MFTLIYAMATMKEMCCRHWGWPF